MTKLRELMRDIIDTKQIPNIDIAGIAYDSRKVKPGYLFAALKGQALDGHQFIPQAVAKGATVLLGSDVMQEMDVPYLRVASPRKSLATIAARYYGDPTQHIPVIGLTGTNGKTTCSYLIEAILKAASYSPAVMGTIHYRFKNQETPAPLTTPEAVDLQEWIAQAENKGANALVMEISSHGLALERAHACHLDAAIFTNLSQDHLDFHGSMEEYFQAKARLFTELLPASAKRNKYAILNWEDPYARQLAEQISATHILRCGKDSALEYYIEADELRPDGAQARIATPDGILTIQSSLIGAFNLQNILLSAACCHALGVPLETIAEGIAQMQGVPGRLERVMTEKDFSVFIDYAHTPDALRHVLETLKAFIGARVAPSTGKASGASPSRSRRSLGTSSQSKGRLITVFGCGGDRDVEKRPLMGHAAARLSDVLIVTSDNPRTEDPEAIIAQILPGIRAERTPIFEEKSARGYLVEPDRRQAIQRAMQTAQAGDIVLIAGKGHEDYQILGTKKIHFDDCERCGGPSTETKRPV